MHKFCVCLLEYSSIIITIIIVYLFSIRKGENPAFILNFLKNVRIYTIIRVMMLQFLQLFFQ
jgi:hypothetical protein